VTEKPLSDAGLAVVLVGVAYFVAMATLARHGHEGGPIMDRMDTIALAWTMIGMTALAILSASLGWYY
jgi:hypothetical protein